MKSKILILSLILFTSCNLKEELKKYEEITDDLKTTFKHEKIRLNQHWGTEENEDFVLILFYDFDLESNSFEDLEKLSSKVIYRLIAKNISYKKLDYIEVRFTNSVDSGSINSFSSFKKGNDELNY